MWSEWQNKLEYQETDLQDNINRVNQLEGEKKALNKQLLETKKEMREQTL